MKDHSNLVVFERIMILDRNIINVCEFKMSQRYSWVSDKNVESSSGSMNLTPCVYERTEMFATDICRRLFAIRCKHEEYIHLHS